MGVPGLDLGICKTPAELSLRTWVLIALRASCLEGLADHPDLRLGKMCRCVTLETPEGQKGRPFRPGVRSGTSLVSASDSQVRMVFLGDIHVPFTINHRIDLYLQPASL